MAEKKKSSCAGLFMKGFVVSGLLLSNLAAIGVIVSIKFLDADYATWTDFSHPTSRPFLAVYLILAVSAGLGFLVGLAGAAVSAIFSGSDSKKSGGGRSKASRPRPQSNRRTTI